MNPYLLRLNRTLHWMTSAVGLASLLFFSLTGLTLNHPDWFGVERETRFEEHGVPAAWLARFSAATQREQLGLLAEVVEERWGLPVPRNVDHDEYEWVLDYQRPGGVSTVVLDIEAGMLSLEAVDDGAIALVNDLHKGRHAGTAWFYLIDVVAVVCLVFAISGIVLLAMYAPRRPSTWPLVITGTLVPLLVFWIFVP